MNLKVPLVWVMSKRIVTVLGPGYVIACCFSYYFNMHASERLKTIRDVNSLEG